MKAFRIHLLSLLLLVCILMSALTACGGDSNDPADGTQPEHVNYADGMKLDMASSTLKETVTVKSFIDGDTTHFHVPASVDPTGLMKARFLAVNTPESTGKIEEWGKTAAAFTKSKLESAVSIIVESDNEMWNFDGNGRFLVWVWYQPSGGAEYRNLNIELLEAGLAVGSSASEGRYGETAVAAIAQAKEEKLYVFSDDVDPLFPYDAAASVTIKELRTHIEDYNGTNVSFEGTVAYNSDWNAYIEAYDAETDMYYGMNVFYGYTSTLINVLAQGNTVRIVGTLQYSDIVGSYQVSNLSYNPMKPNDPANTAKISTGGAPSFTEITPAVFNGDKTIEVDEEEKNFKYAELALSTSVLMKNLVVTDIYTTTNDSSSSKGAMTLTCQVGDEIVSIRTAVLKDADGNLITESYFEGATIDVMGLVEHYKAEGATTGSYQIKVYSISDITIH